jgi:hypothetical protein
VLQLVVLGHAESGHAVCVLMLLLVLALGKRCILCVRACVRVCVRVYVDWARTTICLHAHPQEPGLRATLFHTRHTHIYRMCVRM